MASCHHLTMIDSTLSGDILEIEMFNYSGWRINFDCTDCKFEVQFEDLHLKVLEINDYNSSIAMMSVVVQDVQSLKYYLYAKGSPEKIQKISSSDANYHETQLTELTI